MGKRGGKREGAGRKRTVPLGAKQASFMLTDDERLAVKEYIKHLRAGETFDGAIYNINVKLNIQF